MSTRFEKLVEFSQNSNNYGANLRKLFRAPRANRGVKRGSRAFPKNVTVLVVNNPKKAPRVRKTGRSGYRKRVSKDVSLINNVNNYGSNLGRMFLERKTRSNKGVKRGSRAFPRNVNLFR